MHAQRLLVMTFMASLGLWAAFQIACEVFPSDLAYRLGATPSAVVYRDARDLAGRGAVAGRMRNQSMHDNDRTLHATKYDAST